MVNGYKRLLVWQKAKALALDVYRVTKDFPADEKFGLTSQMRRACVSVVSNIAEGQGRASKGENLQFLGMANGSLLELDTQLTLAFELGFIGEKCSKTLGDEIYAVQGLIAGLRRSLGNSRAISS